MAIFTPPRQELLKWPSFSLGQPSTRLLDGQYSMSSWLGALPGVCKSANVLHKSAEFCTFGIFLHAPKVSAWRVIPDIRPPPNLLQEEGLTLPRTTPRIARNNRIGEVWHDPCSANRFLRF